jgi:Ca2+-binding RTX toxin-like protein
VLGAGIGDTISGGLGTDTFDAQGVVSAFGATITGVENLALDLDTLTIGSTPFGDFVRVVASGGATQGNVQLLGAGGGTVDVQQLQTLVVTADGADQVLTFTTSTATKTNIVVTAAGGNDIVTGGAGADTLDGGSGNDLLIGEGGTDNLSGGGGDDGLVGGNGRDRLNGGSGNDVLTGGAGKDVLEGGIGADTFRWFVASEGGDRIRDFVTGGDKLAFSAGGFGGQLVAGVPLDPGKLVVHASNASTSAAGVGQFIFNTNTNTLRWDVDGGGLAGSVVIAELTGVAQIFATDFVIFA